MLSAGDEMSLCASLPLAIPDSRLQEATMPPERLTVDSLLEIIRDTLRLLRGEHPDEALELLEAVSVVLALDTGN